MWTVVHLNIALISPSYVVRMGIGWQPNFLFSAKYNAVSVLQKDAPNCLYYGEGEIKGQNY